MNAVLLSAIMGQQSYDADAVSIFERITTPPTTAVKNAINTAVIGLKAAGILAITDSLMVAADAADSQAGLLDWLRAATAVANGSSAWSAANGFDGSSVASSGFDSNFAPASHGVNFTLNDAAIFFYVTTQNSNNSYLTGRGGGTSTKLTHVQSSAAQALTIQLNGGSSLVTGSGAGVAGFHVVQRSGGMLYHYRDGTLIASGASTAQALATDNLWICSGLSGALPSDVNIAAWGAGAPLSTGQMNSIKSIIDAYMAAL